MQENSYLSKIVLVTICLEMVPNHIITQVFKDYHLHIPNKIQCLTVITILIPTGKFFDINTDAGYSPIYHTNTGINHLTM